MKVNGLSTLTVIHHLYFNIAKMEDFALILASITTIFQQILHG